MSQQINLFNPVFLAQKKHFSAAAMLQALGLVLAGMLLVEAFAVQQSRSLERLMAETTREAAQRREQLIALGKQYSDQGTSKRLEQDIAQVEMQLRKRTELLAEIKTSVGSNPGGFSRYLAALGRHTLQGVWLTGIDVSAGSKDLVIKGRALRAELVPAYVRLLSRDAAFAGRTVSALRVTAKEETAGAVGAARAPQKPAAPARFLEFTLNIPLAHGAVEGLAAERGAA